jgi:hypothetical protein
MSVVAMDACQGHSTALQLSWKIKDSVTSRLIRVQWSSTRWTINIHVLRWQLQEQWLNEEQIKFTNTSGEQVRLSPCFQLGKIANLSGNWTTQVVITQIPTETNRRWLTIVLKFLFSQENVYIIMIIRGIFQKKKGRPELC